MSYFDCLAITVGLIFVYILNFIHADDTVLLAPSPKALQMLIDLCVAFGIDNIVYNEKTMCMCIKPSVMKDFMYLRFISGI